MRHAAYSRGFYAPVTLPGAPRRVQQHKEVMQGASVYSVDLCFSSNMHSTMEAS